MRRKQTTVIAGHDAPRAGPRGETEPASMSRRIERGSSHTFFGFRNEVAELDDQGMKKSMHKRRP